jgi:putative tricarboxylic transport membrane protein
MSDVASGPRVAEARRRYHLIGGSILAVAGIVLLGSSFMVQQAVPFSVLASIVVFIAVGVAIAGGFLKVQNPQDVYGGMALVLLALVAFVASNSLPGMRGFAFGPGTAPRLFALTLMVLSIGVVVMGFIIRGPDVSRYKFRSIIFITGSVLVFAATIRPLGLVIASFATMMVCAAAAEDVKWPQSIAVAAVLTAFCSVLFPYGLNLPFQLWPRFW